ncbi:MAG: type II toxin-antitoxin system Phd/YefM family antitoxin [Chloroflexota bacterium]|nr:type II toxin-antitoxin system Phd/YefM family antitoxin [Chloroflexota bacterium]MDQ5864842.1 type II toxin-antitoxin system Phd/YefM family antitoxin [Chloroflexota bacterium]
MAITIPIVEARNTLTSLPEQLDKEPDIASRVVTVTRRGQPVLAIMTWELYDSIRDTMQILADPALMAQLRQSIQEIQAGETEDWEAIKSELGLNG